MKEPACGQVLSKCSTPLEGAKALCNFALRRGSGDNISVLIIDLHKFAPQPPHGSSPRQSRSAGGGAARRSAGGDGAPE